MHFFRPIAVLVLSLALPASDLVLVALAARLTLGFRARNRACTLLLMGLVARLLMDTACGALLRAAVAPDPHQADPCTAVHDLLEALA